MLVPGPSIRGRERIENRIRGNSINVREEGIKERREKRFNIPSAPASFFLFSFPLLSQQTVYGVTISFPLPLSLSLVHAPLLPSLPFISSLFSPLYFLLSRRNENTTTELDDAAVCPVNGCYQAKNITQGILLKKYCMIVR